ncbi:hypothetical protein NSPZN2_10222 [Nitrospira defluvii]|uniref:Uncharacterized protein n=1 Tax=Nitrospira defluvii TaxID=330214 RepID=A0ABM8QD99_9BACT|nr:hypothetical protein NSPZN2_10222 [Nitrospira defluvii]
MRRKKRRRRFRSLRKIPPPEERLEGGFLSRSDRQRNDEPALLAKLALLLHGKHHERFAVAELAFFERDDRLRFADAHQVLFGKRECLFLTRRHHIEVQLAVLSLDPGIVHVDAVHLVSHADSTPCCEVD